MRFGRLLLTSLGLLVLSATAVRGNDDTVPSLRAAWRRAETPKERANLVPRIVALRTPDAASMLAHLSRTDPDAVARAAAARGLGTIDVDEAIDLLVAGVLEGGPRQVREMLARGLSRRKGGDERVLRALDEPRVSDADAALLLIALGSFRDPLTLAVSRSASW